MMQGYDEMYLEDAMNNLGESLDFAVNVCQLTADSFMDLFETGGIAEQFEKGNPKYLFGLSGSELVLDVLEKTGISVSDQLSRIDYDCSPEYWLGWVLAYAQWKSGRSFQDIHQKISMEELLKLYPTLHEASEDKFADTIESILERRKDVSKLQKQRRRCGYSQRELSEKTGVNLRTLQQYELRTKDLSKASVTTVRSLAQALGCSMETLLD